MTGREPYRNWAKFNPGLISFSHQRELIIITVKLLMGYIQIGATFLDRKLDLPKLKQFKTKAAGFAKRSS